MAVHDFIGVLLGGSGPSLGKAIPEFRKRKSTRLSRGSAVTRESPAGIKALERGC